MKQAENLLRQAHSIIRRMGIHPLFLALGLLFCLFFPRFFLLAALGYAVLWVVRNVGFNPRSRDGKGRKKNPRSTP